MHLYGLAMIYVSIRGPDGWRSPFLERKPVKLGTVTEAVCQDARLTNQKELQIPIDTWEQ